jgi:hypothetical protein
MLQVSDMARELDRVVGDDAPICHQKADPVTRLRAQFRECVVVDRVSACVEPVKRVPLYISLVQDRCNRRIGNTEAASNCSLARPRAVQRNDLFPI